MVVRRLIGGPRRGVAGPRRARAAGLRASAALVAATALLGIASAFLPARAQTAGVPSEADKLLAAAREALDSNHLSAAIRAYVGLLAERNGSDGSDGDPASAAAARIAEAELQAIGGRLSIEPASEWLDSKGGQAAESTGSLSRPGARGPAVHLYVNFGAGSSPVDDATIRFEFIENSGSLVTPVSTDRFGRANTTITRIDDPAAPARIRAYPVFEARGKAYAFPAVFRDFAYLPPVNAARIAALEVSELGAGPGDRTLDALADALGSAGIELAAGEPLSERTFRLAFGGDGAALAALVPGGGRGGAALALVEITDLRQVELNGKKYNIFTSQARAAFRFLRADGSALFALPVEGLKGQGGSRESAVADGLRKAREALAAELKRRLPEFRAALARE